MLFAKSRPGDDSSQGRQGPGLMAWPKEWCGVDTLAHLGVPDETIDYLIDLNVGVCDI